MSLLSVFAGVCPSGEWKSLQSRCYYLPKSLKLSYAGAASACQRQGAELAWPDNRVITKVEQGFMTYGVIEAWHGKSRSWTGMKNRTYLYKRDFYTYFRNTQCGAYRSLLYVDHGNNLKPSCTTLHHFVCELEKGKS